LPPSAPVLGAHGRLHPPLPAAAAAAVLAVVMRVRACQNKARGGELQVRV